MPDVRCLTEHAPVKMSPGARHRLVIMTRFEEFLATNHDRPVSLAEICAATGASERTLRNCCQEHLGMGPIRYRWLRRMQLARRALLQADPIDATVTGIAMDYGFWELGRFATEYRALFGELPSATLRRPPDDQRTSRSYPLTLPMTESA
jgi:AraC-like DNA-binding protein